MLKSPYANRKKALSLPSQHHQGYYHAIYA